MKKRICSVLLAAALAMPSVMPSYTLTAFAQEQNETAPQADTTLLYSHDDLVTLNNGDNPLTVTDAAELAKFAALESFTFETSFTCTNALSTVFFIGNSSQNSHYMNVFVTNGGTVGIETLTASGQKPVDTRVALTNTSFGKEHLLAVSFDAKSTVKFYIDGKLVHSANVTANAVKDVLSGVDYVGFGKGNRASGGNNYPMSGTLKNIRVYSDARSGEQIIQDQLGNLATTAYSGGSVYDANAARKTDTSTESIDSLKDMTEGTWAVRFRMDGSKTNGLSYLASFSQGSVRDNFVSLYLHYYNNEWRAGIDAPGKNIGAYKVIPDTINVTDQHWHDLIAVRSGNNWTFYLDGQSLGTASSTDAGWFNKITAPNTISYGFCKRSQADIMNPFGGSIESIKVYPGVLNAIEAQLASESLSLSGQTTVKDGYLSDKTTLFEVGYDKSAAYRIPSLITTDKGTVIAGIDKRNDGFADQGNIDLAIRRKESGSTEFDDPIIISDLLKKQGGKSAVMIDSLMMQDLDEDSPHKGRIHLLVDMFTQSNAAMESGNQENGDQYLHIGNNAYRAVYKDGESQPYAVVEEDGYGIVYTTTGSGDSIQLGTKTDYTVTLHGPQPFTTLGNLYKNGEYAGNIFMNEDGPDKGELHMKKHMSIWHFYSDDDGKTWSEPQNITPMAKESWMTFFGTGPGRGLQLTNGRLVAPIYTATKNNFGGSQYSATIVSDDFGETWKLKNSPVQDVWGYDRSQGNGNILTEAQCVQLKNSDVLMFMRATGGKVKVARSTDNCESWESIEDTPIANVYCQLSAISYTGKDGKERVMIATPAGPARTHGVVTVGEVQEDGSIDWQIDKAKLMEPTGYAYSCLTEIAPAEDGTKRFANFYELNNDPIVMTYVEFDENYLYSDEEAIENKAPELTFTSAKMVDGKLVVEASADQTVFAAGDVKLQVSCEDETAELALKSGSGSTSLVFEGDIPSDWTYASADSLKEGAELSNVYGKAAVMTKQDLIDFTVVHPASIVAYTSQFSDSTAENADGAAVNIIDGNEKTYWHSHYNNSQVMPQVITFDMGKEVTVVQMNFLNRQTSTNAICKDFLLESSTDGQNWTEVLDSTMPNTQKWIHVALPETTARYFRFSEKNNYSSNLWATIAELSFNTPGGIDTRAGDFSALSNLVGRVKGMEDGMTKASWDNTKVVLEKAEAMITANNASQSEIDATLQDLRDVSRQLTTKSFLQKEIDRFNDLNASDYTAASWKNYTDIRTETMNTIDQIETPIDMDRKLMKLANARLDLEAYVPVTVDKSQLQTAFNKAYALDFTQFEDGYKALEDKKAEYQALLNSDEATQEEVNAKAKEINNQLLALRLKPNSEKLSGIKK